MFLIESKHKGLKMIEDYDLMPAQFEQLDGEELLIPVHDMGSENK